MICDILLESLLHVFDRPQNSRDVSLEGNQYVFDVLGAKQTFSRDEVRLAPVTFLAQFMDDGPGENMILFEDLFVVSGNGNQALLMLRGSGVELLKVLNVFITKNGWVTPVSDDKPTAHMLFVDGGEALFFSSSSKCLKKSNNSSPL